MPREKSTLNNIDPGPMNQVIKMKAVRQYFHINSHPSPWGGTTNYENWLSASWKAFDTFT
jgi:hypothetical protein